MVFPVRKMDREEIATRVYDLAQAQEPIARPVKEALGVLESCLARYGPERVSLSFNGGKDCTALLHLYAAVLSHKNGQHGQTQAIPAIYIPVPSPFPEMEDFVAQAVDAYGLDLFTCVPPSDGAPLSGSATPETTGVASPAAGGEGMKRALGSYKARFPRIEAILIGTRRTDPHGAALTHQAKCDPGWPAFERINPIIDWSYSDVWAFLKKLDVPYCSLYDQGYTSLGSTYNSFPNPALLVPSMSEASYFFPSSLVVLADNPNAVCLAEKPPATPRISPWDQSFTLIAHDPDRTCIAEPGTVLKVSRQALSACGLGCFHVIADDPSTMCRAECTPPVQEGTPPQVQTPSPRYRPAYELADGRLERAGRVSGAASATVMS